MSHDLTKFTKENALIYTSPEEQIDNHVYSTLNTVININQTMFHKIWPGYYPKKELTNQIGAAMGIEFSKDVQFDEVFGDVTEYPDGRKVRKVEGYRCSKTGRRRRPDGTWSSWTESYEFNWGNRATLDFLKDEESPEADQKYKTDKQKQKHIAELKNFATQRASTGADLCVIRDLSGMPTSFKADDIKKGVILVSQIVESKYFQAKKAAAIIDNTRLGGVSALEIDNAAQLLTGKPSDVREDLKAEDPEPETIPKENPEPAAAEVKSDPPAEKTPPGLKEQFEEMENLENIDKMPVPYSEFKKTVVENDYSAPVLEWAITSMMEQLQGIS